MLYFFQGYNVKSNVTLYSTSRATIKDSKLQNDFSGKWIWPKMKGVIFPEVLSTDTTLLPIEVHASFIMDFNVSRERPIRKTFEYPTLNSHCVREV